jgi:hypothetical protein
MARSGRGEIEDWGCAEVEGRDQMDFYFNSLPGRVVTISSVAWLVGLGAHAAQLAVCRFSATGWSG